MGAAAHILTLPRTGTAILPSSSNDKDSEALKSPGIDVKTLAGKRLRVRGWVEWRNGPMIHVTLLEQIELLPAEATPAPQGQEAPPIGAIAL